MTALTGKMQQRRDTAANWTSNNPTLAAGEIGWESDTMASKIGDGTTAWTSLAYTIGKSVSFTPSWTNITVGSSTNSGSYFMVGKLVHFVATITSGASFAISGTPRLALPVTAAATPSPAQFNVWFLDNGTQEFPGFVSSVNMSTTSTGNLLAERATQTFVDSSGVSSSVPFVWSTGGDILTVAGWYTAA